MRATVSTAPLPPMASKGGSYYSIPLSFPHFFFLNMKPLWLLLWCAVHNIPFRMCGICCTGHNWSHNRKGSGSKFSTRTFFPSKLCGLWPYSTFEPAKRWLTSGPSQSPLSTTSMSHGLPTGRIAPPPWLSRWDQKELVSLAKVLPHLWNSVGLKCAKCHIIKKGVI